MLSVPWMAAVSVAGRMEPVAPRTMRVMIMANIAAMKRYVGAAKIEPDSRMPRRLPTMISAMSATQMATRWLPAAGIALWIWSTPLATETATVST